MKPSSEEKKQKRERERKRQISLDFDSKDVCQLTKERVLVLSPNGVKKVKIKECLFIIQFL